MKSTLCRDTILGYVDDVLNGRELVSEDVILQCKLVKKAFETEELIVEEERYVAYLAIGEAMYGKAIPWEKFLLAISLCVYTKDHQPRWDEIFCMLGRGNGKDGFIAWISLCLISRHNPIQKYDVDICANNEDQSTRPVKDVVEFLEAPASIAKNKKAFHWTLEGVKGLVNRGSIKGHTNSPKGKDGLRSGSVILNEIHQYENYGNIDVFTTGLGKVAEPRKFFFTTNGYVREGVLDDKLQEAEDVLNGLLPDDGRFYFICRLDNEDEVHDEKNWVKANPSLPYFPHLMTEIRKEYAKWKQTPRTLPAFMAKRMNLPQSANEKEVVAYEYIKATNQPLIDLERMSCVCGVDLSRTTDMCSATLLFKDGDVRYVINHNWICTQSQDWGVIRVVDKFPEWEAMGILTVVDDVEINPKRVVDWIEEQMLHYNVQKVCIDSFRYSIFSDYLGRIGFSKENRNLKLVKNNDIAMIVPVVESVFINKNFVWGDNPLLRWATNNTKLVPYRSYNTSNADLGNWLYAKIEHHSRKTDPFMSLVAAMTSDMDIYEKIDIDLDLFKAVSF